MPVARVACLGVDETGLVPFVRRLSDLGIEIISTEGCTTWWRAKTSPGSESRIEETGTSRERRRATKRKTDEESGEGSPTDGLTSSRKIVRKSRVYGSLYLVKLPPSQGRCTGSSPVRAANTQVTELTCPFHKAAGPGKLQDAAGAGWSPFASSKMAVFSTSTPTYPYRVLLFWDSVDPLGSGF